MSVTFANIHMNSTKYYENKTKNYLSRHCPIIVNGHLMIQWP